MPEDEEDLRAISAEADFYQIQGLLGLLHGRALREQALGPENIALRNKENQVPQHKPKRPRRKKFFFYFYFNP